MAFIEVVGGGGERCGAGQSIPAEDGCPDVITIF